MEFVYINEQDSEGVIFLTLVEKGFDKEIAFSMLNQIKSCFFSMFDKDLIKKAKLFELNPRFRRELKSLTVFFFL